MDPVDSLPHQRMAFAAFFMMCMEQFGRLWFDFLITVLMTVFPTSRRPELTLSRVATGAAHEVSEAWGLASEQRLGALRLLRLLLRRDAGGVFRVVLLLFRHDFLVLGCVDEEGNLANFVGIGAGKV